MRVSIQPEDCMYASICHTIACKHIFNYLPPGTARGRDLRFLARAGRASSPELPALYEHYSAVLATAASAKSATKQRVDLNSAQQHLHEFHVVQLFSRAAKDPS